jgi:hypothetical protein
MSLRDRRTMRVISMPCGQLHLRGNLPQCTETHAATLDQQTTGKRKAFSQEKESMLNIAKHAAMAAAGIGLAAMAAPPAADACFVPAAYGCAGAAFGMYRPVIHRFYGYAYHPAFGYAVPHYRVYHPIAFRIFRPVTYAWATPHYSAYGYAQAVPRHRVYHRVAFRIFRPATYAMAAPHYSAYGYAQAVPRYRVYHRVAFRVFRPVTYAWAVPHYRYRSYGAAYGAYGAGAAYGAYRPVRRVYAFVPRYRPVFAFAPRPVFRAAFACGC